MQGGQGDVGWTRRCRVDKAMQGGQGDAGWTRRCRVDKAMHRVSAKEREEVERTTKYKMAR